MQQPPDQQPYTMPPGQNPMGESDLGGQPIRETPSGQPGMRPSGAQGAAPASGSPHEDAPPEWHHARSETEAIREAGIQPATHQYIVFADMVGRPLIDLGTGSQLGVVADLVLTRNYHIVEAFATHSKVLQGSDAFPASNTIVGADAITLPRGSLQGFDENRLRGLPFASTLLE